jgi:hypothetical protein
VLMSVFDPLRTLASAAKPDAMIAAITILVQSSLAAGTSLLGCHPESRKQWLSEACRKDELEIYDARSGPIIHHRRTIEIFYPTMHATGSSELNVALLQMRSYRILWTHRFLEVDDNEGTKNSRVRYRWHYEPRRARLIVTGTESRGGPYDLGTGSGRARSIRRLPTEFYSYSSRLGKFVRC